MNNIVYIMYIWDKETPPTKTVNVVSAGVTPMDE